MLFHEHELRCPLTQRKDVELVDVIPVSELVELYRSFWNWDISQEFGGTKEIRRYYTPAAEFWFFDPPVTGSPSYYAHLSTIMPYQENKFEFNFARKLIGEADNVFEFGCGDGHFGSDLNCARYTGLEHNASAISVAAGRGLDVRKFSDAYVPDGGKYNVICAFQTLEHVADPALALSSWIGALEPGGRLILGLPNCASFVALMINNCLNLPPHHVTWWTPTTVNFLANLFPVEIETVVQTTAAEDGTESSIAHTIIERCLFDLIEGQKSHLVSAIPDLMKYRRLRDSLAEQLLTQCRQFIEPMTAHTMIGVLRKPESGARVSVGSGASRTEVLGRVHGRGQLCCRRAAH
jgi:SAM-dependent methyltransferase